MKRKERLERHDQTPTAMLTGTLQSKTEDAAFFQDTSLRIQYSSYNRSSLTLSHFPRGALSK
jgi:hypothetical protein